MTRARIGRARRERVGSSGGFGRGDGHEPARELVGVRLVGGEGETAVTRGWGKEAALYGGAELTCAGHADVRLIGEPRPKTFCTPM
jgi:hypothetical protein